MGLKLRSTQIDWKRLERKNMTDEEMVRKAVAINCEIAITHGVDGGVGFEWRGTFIRDPFADPQYGAFPVDPAQQYGDAYLNSLFVIDPAKALKMARQQLRDKASEGLNRFYVNADGSIAVIEAACGVRVPYSADLLETLTYEQFAMGVGARRRSDSAQFDGG